ncbi:GLUG motif-containing protein [Methylosinus sp. sav-2]|uniref:beta strand repeat-containing protein n=1 Tax=Methylosinus sp. sav-2 TaxID=2485168 RepID=UPI0010D35101|nr:GLUG motif-containing protein [Methylosinus sp. sav-2]TDX62588.1 GLUG motif-containing protein [Methylosinus sp. sav-2]
MAYPEAEYRPLYYRHLDSIHRRRPHNGYPIPLLAPASTQYASVTLSGANAGLKINGTNYTLIQTVAQLDALDSHDATVLPGTTAASVSGNYALGQNIDASGTTYTDALIEKFSGMPAGLDHTVGNLTITSTALVNNNPVSNLALIGQTTAGGLVRDIGVVNANISSSATVVFSSGPQTVYGNFLGALVGSNLANISKAYSTGTVVGGNSGGLIGYNGIFPQPGVFNTISDSFSTVNVTGATVGGLIGRSEYLKIYRSHASGTVDSSLGGNSGGLIGYASNTNVYDSYATGDVLGGTIGVGLGGLIGNVPSGSAPILIRNSFATGNATGFYDLGGLVGTVSSSISNFTLENSYATGNVTSYQNTDVSQPPGIGGLIGAASSFGSNIVTITNSHATGNVTYTGAFGTGAGGLVGYTQGNGLIANSYATGNVTGVSGTGGLIGTGGSTNITNSYATGNVTGGNNAGGLAGSSSATITNSYATGNVVANVQAGGLVGTNAGGTITGSHATGSVTALGTTTNATLASAGGLVGTNFGLISNSYATGAVTGQSGYTGGIAGVNFNNSGNPNNTTTGVINNSYYNSEVNPSLPATNFPSGLASQLVAGKVTGGGGLTSAQIKDAPFYINGTINQVFAARAAAAEAAAAASAAAARLAQTQHAASGAGNVISNRATAPTTVPNGLLATAGRAAVEAVSSADVDALIQGCEPTQTPLPAVRTHTQHASTTTSGPHKVHVSSPGAHYRARIRSIEVDGQHFDLDNGGRNSAPTPNAQ